MEELAACGMPGPDYIVKAPNVTLDAWLERPAQYHDFPRALHLLLMIYGGRTPSRLSNLLLMVAGMSRLLREHNWRLRASLPITRWKP